MESNEQLREIWQGRRQDQNHGWPASGLAIEGDFAGIQRFILKPVPGARGAAKRLRGRSLLVVALSHLAAQYVARAFEGTVFLAAGGRFLIWTANRDKWRERLAEVQSDFDRWFLEQFDGEVVFHLCAAEFHSGLVPREKLSQEMAARRQTPLGGRLVQGQEWAADAFVRLPIFDPPDYKPFRCPACLSTADRSVTQRDEDHGEEICLACDRDKRLGAKLASMHDQPYLVPAESGEIPFFAQRYRLSGRAGDDSEKLALIHHMPRVGHQPLTLEEVAAYSPGDRRLLGYLRLDADLVGQQFRDCQGDPARTRALSRLLQNFFCGQVQDLVARECPLLYPVFGGGDDLFMIGAWNHALDFVDLLRQRFAAIFGPKLTFSAALVLSKPKQHILTKADQSEAELQTKAKAHRNSLHALGCTIPLGELAPLLRQAKSLSAPHRDKHLPSAFLYNVLELHRRWVEDPSVERYRPLLHYQSARNLSQPAFAEARNWAASLLRDPSAWRFAPFVARYVLLASERRNDQGRS
jgi:CRISPR-associated protein Csm1